ncbi:MAG: hypothetical protein ABUL77_04165 [Bacteroidota bacterium]
MSSRPSRGAERARRLHPRPSPLLAAAAVAGMLVHAGPDARGAPAQEDDGSPPAIAIVIAAGDAPAKAALTASLRRSLERLGGQVTFGEVDAMNPRDVAAVIAHGAVAVNVWIDFAVPRKATIYVTEGKSVYVRPLVLDHGLDPVALDLLEVVVTGSVDTLLAGRPLGVSREEFTRSLQPPPAPAREDEAPATARGRRVFSLAGLYEGLAVARDQLVHGPGVLLGMDQGYFRFGLGLHGHLPYEVTAAGTTVRLIPEGVRLSVGRLFAAGAGVAIVIAVGAGVDITHVRARPNQPDVTAAAAFTAVDPVVRPTVTVERRWGGMAAGIVLGLDVDLVRPHYVLQSTTGRRPLWTPSPLRPVAALVVRFDLL